MAQPTANVSDSLVQLESARKLVLGDPNFYEQIVNGVLPIIGPNSHVDLRRWGAEFLAETFASPVLPAQTRETLSLNVLPLLKDLLETPEQDATVVKSVIQTATSLYPVVFRRIISHSTETQVWERMVAIKSNIMRRWDSSPIGVQVCCIKFAQKVVHVQTPGLISDPRRPDQNETSIALVPRNHPLIPLPNLEAEASGLLDRLLDVFQQNASNAILIDATLNCMALLIRTRPAVANKIISAILNFNPLKQANSPMTPRMRVLVKSMERTTRALLINVNKRNPNGPMAGKIQAYVERLMQARNDIFDDVSRKRGAPMDGTPDAKRAKLAPSAHKFPPLPPGPNSFAQLFTLTTDVGLTSFDVKQLPEAMVANIAGLVLEKIDQVALEAAINEIRARYAHLQKIAQPTPVPDVPMAGPTGIDDEDDYDPADYMPAEDPSSAAFSSEVQQAVTELQQPDIALGPFVLPKPPPLTEQETAMLSQQTVNRVFGMMASLKTSSSRASLGFSRLAASTNDRDAWVTVMTRIATRAPADLETFDSEDEDGDAVKTEDQEDPEKPSLANGIRQSLFEYVLSDFRANLNIAVSWLCEEWYNDKTLALQDVPNTRPPPKVYAHWLHRIIDAILPYLDARDNKVLVRFVSEVPSLDKGALDRIGSLARDPERVTMGVMALQYLVMMRPPVREMALEVLEGMWRDYREAKAPVAKVLKKWRPWVLEGADNAPKKEEETNRVAKAENMDSDRGTPVPHQDPRKLTSPRRRPVAA